MAAGRPDLPVHREQRGLLEPLSIENRELLGANVRIPLLMSDVIYEPWQPWQRWQP